MIDLSTAKRVRRLARAKRREGMTLIEIMIVVIIMALIATAVGVAVLPRLEKARVDSTRADAQTVRSGAIMYIGENPGGACPTMDDLVEGGYIDSNKRTADAWDNPFSVECEGTDIIVVSAGPDGQMGTEDDVM